MTAPGDGTPLVSAGWLADHLDDPTVVILEVAFDLPHKALYFSQGHIPGARYIWWKELCWHDTDREFADPVTMAGRLGALGVSDDSTLILVGDTIQFATYAYWTLTMTGLDHLTRILDGGRQIWDREARLLTHDLPAAATPGRVTPGVGDVSSRVGRDDVLTHLNHPDRVLVDMRSPEEYRGERVSPLTAPIDHGAERKGRIPGARHLYYQRLLAEDGTFLPPADLADRFASVGADDRADVVAYCRLSHRASLGWFAATRLLGRSNLRVYDGSWTEWGSIVGFPIER